MEASRSFSKLRFLAVGFSGLFFFQAEASGLLDLGQLRGFKLTEVFHTLKAWNRQNRQCLVPAAHGKVIYPVTTSLDELELRFQKLDPKIKNKASGSIYVHNNLLFKYYYIFLPNNWHAFFAWSKHDFGIASPALSKCQLAKDSSLHSTGSKRYFANHCTWRLWLCW